jgi:hypothetical protein
MVRNSRETGFEEVSPIGTGKSAYGNDRVCSRLTALHRSNLVLVQQRRLVKGQRTAATWRIACDFHLPSPLSQREALASYGAAQIRLPEFTAGQGGLVIMLRLSLIVARNFTNWVTNFTSCVNLHCCCLVRDRFRVLIQLPLKLKDLTQTI